LPRSDLAYSGAWIAASTLLCLLLLAVHLRFLHARRTWPRVELHGAAVRLSPRAGPAVVGAIRPDIVIPRWLLDHTVEQQKLVITHELQHVRARDPLLLATAWACAVVLPWHPAVWWLLWRVRLGVEMDCDARVIAGGVERQSYGSLLIELTQQGAGLPLSATALSDRTTQLERRLIAMNMNRPSFFALRSGAFALCAGLLVLSACALRKPATPDSLEATLVKEAVDSPAILVKERVSPLLMDVQPTVMERVQFVVDVTPLVAEKQTYVLDIAPPVMDLTLPSVRVVPTLVVPDSQVRPPQKQPLVGPLIIIDGVVQVPPARAVTPTRVDSIEQASRPLILLNGVTVSQDSAADIFRFLTIDRIERIDVVRGATAIERYGERARNGVVNIITRGAGGRGGDFVFGDTIIRVESRLTVRPPSSGQQPLIIVDGVILNADTMQKLDIAPSDIESIEVVRGAAAIRLYGDRAVNGVINIKTKRRGG
jgi:TonB-dependent SusC/RagA subfamily outer membrane receptor